MKKSIYEFQEKIRSLQRVKSSLEQNAFFQSTEVEDHKEQLKITQGEKKAPWNNKIFARLASLKERSLPNGQ